MGPVYQTQINAMDHQLTDGHTQQVNSEFLARKYDSFYQIEVPKCPVYGSFLVPDIYQPDTSFQREDRIDLPRFDICFIPANDATYDPLYPMDGTLVMHIPDGYVINASLFEQKVLEIYPNIPPGLLMTAFFPITENYQGKFITGPHELPQLSIVVKGGRVFPEYLTGMNNNIDEQIGLGLSHFLAIGRTSLESTLNWPLYVEMHTPSTASDLEQLLPEPGSISTGLLILLLGAGLPALVSIINKKIRDLQMAQSTNGVASTPDNKQKK